MTITVYKTVFKMKSHEDVKIGNIFFWQD